MRTLLAILLLGALSARAYAADVGQVWNELFTAEEQRVIHALKADPAADRTLRSGLAAVMAAQEDPAKFEAEKRRFQVEWLDRVADFSTKYKAEDPALMANMQRLPKPAVATVRVRVPWFSVVDERDWEGRLVPGVLGKMNPHEVGYTVASMRAFTPTQRQELLGQMGSAKSWRIPTVVLIEKLIGETRGKFAGDMDDVLLQNPGRVRTAQAKLSAAESVLVARVETPQPRVEETREGGESVLEGSRSAREQLERTESVVRQAEGGTEERVREAGEVMDGAGRNGSDTPPVVVPPAGPGELETGPVPGLQPSPGDTPTGGLTIDDIPPPPAPEGEITSKRDTNKFGVALSSPYVRAGIGAVLGGLLGFLLLGPIGAAIGALAGGAAGYFTANKS